MAQAGTWATTGHLYGLGCVAGDTSRHGDEGSELPPAHEAAREGHVDVLRSIIQECGAEVLLQADRKGFLPAHLAARNDNVDVIQFLASEHGGAGFTARSTHGVTPAHLAARHGCVDILRLLAEHGGQTVLSAEDADGWQPVHSAVRGGHLDAMQYIVNELGSDFWVRPQLQKSIEIAKRYSQAEVRTPPWEDPAFPGRPPEPAPMRAPPAAPDPPRLPLPTAGARRPQGDN